MKLSQLDEKGLNLAPGISLTEQQIKGLRHMLSHKAALIRGQVGSGKSLLSTTAATHIMRHFPKVRTVILCPVGATKAMIKAIKMLGGTYRLYDASGTSGNGGESCSFHVFNFSTMDRYEDTLYKLANTYNLVGIIDEAHALQSTESAQYGVFRKMRGYFKILWLLTATPLMSVNNIRGLYNMMEYLEPNFFGTWAKFRANYLRVKTETFQVKGKTISNEVVVAVREPEALREKVSILMVSLVVKYNVRYHYINCELTGEEITYYKRAGQGVMNAEYDSKSSKKREFSHRLHDLQRVVDWSHESLPNHLARKMSSKEKELVKLLQKIFAEGLSVIVYTEYIDTANRLKSLLSSCKKKGILDMSEMFSITGKDSKASRNAVEDAIVPKSVVICTQAGSQSRNLQKASQVIFYDIPFSIGRFIQVVGRVTRIDSKFEGQDVYFLEAKDTIDTYKRLLMQDNAFVLDSIFGEDSNLPDLSKLDRNSLSELRQKLLWKFSGYDPEEYRN